MNNQPQPDPADAPRDVHTEGGDYIEGDADQRQGTFVDGNQHNYYYGDSQSEQPPIPPAVDLPNLLPVANNLIGHAAEREQLNDWFDTMATERHGRFAFITGRPGYGKRALLQTLVDDVREQGGTALLLRCWPTARASDAAQDAVWNDDPLLDQAALALEPQIRQTWPRATQIAQREWVRVMAQAAHALGRLPTPQAERLPDDPTALKALLRQLARSSGVVLAIEGFDHAADMWIELLRDMAVEIERDLPLLVLATLTLHTPLATLPKAHYTEPLHFVHTLQKEQRAELLWLDAVTIADISDYTGPAERQIAPRLHELADGIPVIVESIWAEWQETGLVAQNKDGVWRVTDNKDGWVTGGLRDMPLRLLRKRVTADAPLDWQQVDELLGCAALEGRTFTAQAVALALVYDVDTVLDVLDEFLLDEHQLDPALFADAPPRAGLIAEVGYANLPDDAAGQPPNLYRFLYPYLWHMWARYGLAAPRRRDLQGRLAAALETVYHGTSASVAGTLIRLFEVSGQPQRAEPYRRAGQRNADIATLLWQIGVLEHAESAFDTARLFELRLEACEKLYDMGGYAQGIPLARAALQQAEEWHATLRIASAANILGMLLHAQGGYAAARPLLERALTIHEQVLGPQHLGTASSLNNLGSLLRDQGDYAAARSLYERALAIREQILGPQHPDTAVSLTNLGGLLRDQGNQGDDAARPLLERAARPLLERALAIHEQVLGPQHPLTANSLTDLGGLLCNQGDYAAARPMIERALAIREQVLGPQHPKTAQSLNNLGWLLRNQGDDAARPLLERALAIREQVLGPQHPLTASSLNHLASLCYDEGNFAEAAMLIRRALRINEATLGPQHPDTQNLRQGLELIEQRLAEGGGG